MPDRDLCFTSATRLARLYRARKVSSLEVMQAVLARIDAVNPRVSVYVTIARPVGLQIVGRRRREAAVLGAAAASEAAPPWANRIPPVVAGAARP